MRSVHRKSLLFVTTVFLLSATIIEGQTGDMNEIQYQRATQVLENVIAESAKLDLMVAVRVRAKSANIMWLQSPERGRASFLSVWEEIEKENQNPSFDKEEARIVLLRYLYPRDSSFANELLRKLSEKGNTSSDTSFSFERVSGKNEETNRLARLALRLLDTDSTMAAEVLEQSLSRNTAPQSILVLAKLREVDPLLANYVARRGLQNFLNQPPTLAVVGVTHLINYIFPLTPSPAPSLAVEQADEILRAQFMNVGYRILKASLSESEESLKERFKMGSQALGFRTYSQAFLAATLAALSVRYAPYLTPELVVIKDSLLPKLPAPMVQGASMQANIIKSATEPQDSPEGIDAITPVIANGDFGQARSLIEKLGDERLKKIYTKQLVTAEFKSFLALPDLSAARKVALSVEDSSLRIQMFGQLARAAHKRGDVVLSAETLREALKIPVNADYKGVYVRSLFVLSSESAYFAGPDSLVVLRAAVKLLNELTDVEKNKTSGTRQPLSNNITGFVDSNEMMTAFARLARNYFEETLQIAENIENKAVRQQASLSSIEKILMNRTTRSTPQPRTDPNQQ